jgi:HSP20 family protein
MRVRMDIQVGSVPRTRLRRTRVVEKRPLKAWVFTKEPCFTRCQTAPGALEVQKVIEPPLDVFNEAETLLVIAQIPGAAEKDLKLEIQDDLLALEAHAHTRAGHVKYYKEMLLPFEVDGSSIQSSFKDGLLQLELKRKSTGEARGGKKTKRGLASDSG